MIGQSCAGDGLSKYIRKRSRFIIVELFSSFAAVGVFEVFQLPGKQPMRCNSWLFLLNFFCNEMIRKNEDIPIGEKICIN